MKAILCHDYGPPDVLKYEETEIPAVGDDDILIRVRGASVNPIDRLYRGEPYMVRAITGLRKPKNPRMGRDLAGQVEAIGRNVTRFQPGDEVFGVGPGAFAEYACAKEGKLALKPANATFEQAAAVPVAGITALQGLRDKGQIQSGQKVLINGAAGGVGTFAVQIAKSFGADVTGVCSTRNVDMVRSIGADNVVDYTQEDFTRSGQRYDILFDCVGNRSLSACRRIMGPGANYVMVGVQSLIRLLTTRLLLSPFVSQKVVMFMASINNQDLAALKDLIEAGKVTPVTDRCYTLREVPDALRYLEQGHARGKIVITVDQNRPL